MNDPRDLAMIRRTLREWLMKETNTYILPNVTVRGRLETRGNKEMLVLSIPEPSSRR